MGPQGLYLNGWTPDFDPEADIPKAVPIRVRLPNLPMHCWNPKSLHAIGVYLENTLTWLAQRTYTPAPASALRWISKQDYQKLLN